MAGTSGTPGKVSWEGTLLGVQPRIRLLRSYDEQAHTYLGYILCVRGVAGDREGGFRVAIGKGTQAKHGFSAGMRVRGLAVPVTDPRREAADLFRASALKILERPAAEPAAGPPFLGVPPELAVYRQRGHRRLDPRTYESRCRSCLWGCRMPVEILVDPWRPVKKRYRFETFCYGPKNCRLYRAGPRRRVPGRRGMVYVEEDWVDEEQTAHREPEE